MTFVAVGIDAGTKKSGFAALELTRTPAIWMSHGVVDNAEAPDFLRFDRKSRIDLLVVEMPVALHNPMANVMVMLTTSVAGMWVGLAKAMGIEVVTISPAQWRASLIGSARKGTADAKVKEVLSHMVEGMPRCPVHCRDAAGAALIGASIWRRRVA